MTNPKPNLPIYNLPRQQSKPELYFPNVSTESKSEIQDYICKDFPEEELNKKFYNNDIMTVPDMQAIKNRIRFGCKDGESYYLYHVSNIFCEELARATSISIIDT
jgi:hypothetical protein